MLPPCIDDYVASNALARQRDRGLDPDLLRVEPVPTGAAIEHRLEAQDEGDQPAEADEVEGPGPPSRVVGHELQHPSVARIPIGRLI